MDARAVSKWENNFHWEGFQDKIKPFTFRDQSIDNFQIRYAVTIRRGWLAYIFWAETKNQALLQVEPVSISSILEIFDFPSDLE